MPTIPLARLAARQGARRNLALRPIIATQAQAADLAAILLPAAQVWADAKADILAGYVLPTLDGLTVDSAAEINAAIEQTAAGFSRVVVAITFGLRAWAVKAEQIHRTRWLGAIKAGVQVDLSTILTALPVHETLEAFIARNVALVKDISAQAQGRISDAVFRGYQNRTPIREVAKEIDAAASLGRKRAIRVAADQNKKLSAALDRERQAESGIEKFKWRHSGKLHPRVEHVARDGKIYEWAKNDLEGDYPGVAIHCGCRAQAWLDILSELD